MNLMRRTMPGSISILMRRIRLAPVAAPDKHGSFIVDPFYDDLG